MWDYDSIGECILFEKDGRKLLGHFDKNGYFFVLDRTNGERVSITPFVDRITWGAITRDGQVTAKVYPDKEGVPVHFYPGPAGAKEWTHAAYSPKTELFYVPVQDVGATATRRRREFKESIPYWGAGVQVDIEDMAVGRISAFDVNGDEKWRWRNELPMCASVLATGGDLVFAGEPSGEFNALDARSRRAAVAVPVRKRSPQQPDDLHGRRHGSTSPCRSAGAGGPRGSSPACSAPATAAR